LKLSSLSQSNSNMLKLVHVILWTKARYTLATKSKERLTFGRQVDRVGDDVDRDKLSNSTLSPVCTGLNSLNPVQCTHWQQGRLLLKPATNRQQSRLSPIRSTNRQQLEFDSLSRSTLSPTRSTLSPIGSTLSPIRSTLSPVWTFTFNKVDRVEFNFVASVYRA